MRFTKLSTITLRQQVYDQLREKIAFAGVLPGETLSLRGLAREFGVSLMPVREAVWQLESERVVIIETNRRIRVNTLSVPEMQEIFQIRLLLESLTAQRSCKLRPDTALAKARVLLDQTAIHLQKSAAKYVRANFAFHHLIYSYGASAVLMRHIDLLWARVSPYIYYMHLQREVNLSDVQQFHEGMYNAWAAKNAGRMIEWLQKDLTVLPMRFFPQDEQRDSRHSGVRHGSPTAQDVSRAFQERLEAWQRGEGGLHSAPCARRS